MITPIPSDWIQVGPNTWADPETAERLVLTDRKHDEAFKTIRGEHFAACNYFPSENSCKCAQIEALARILLWENDQVVKKIVESVVQVVKDARHILYPESY